MFKRLGTFAVLAVCLFAIVIVMGGCGGDEDRPLPPTEKTFKEQLTEGSWRMVANAAGENINVGAQDAADAIAATIGAPAGALKGTVSQNSLRFDNAGKATWIMGVKISEPGNPEEPFELIYTLKGPYWIREDSGSSAIMTLSFTEGSAQMKTDVEVLEAAVPAEFLGDVIEDERASINGDQLRMGSMIAER